MKLKSKYFIERSKYPTDDITHVLWYESESMSGSGYKGVWHGSYRECLEEKERREANVRKSKGYSFRLLKKALHN